MSRVRGIETVRGGFDGIAGIEDRRANHVGPQNPSALRAPQPRRRLADRTIGELGRQSRVARNSGLKWHDRHATELCLANKFLIKRSVPGVYAVTAIGARQDGITLTAPIACPRGHDHGAHRA